MIGQSITLECVASGTPKPHIKWIRGEESLSFVTNPNLLMVDGGKKLQIINAQLLDADGYTCVASNVAGNATKEFLLKVLGGWYFFLHDRFITVILCLILMVSKVTPRQYALGSLEGLNGQPLNLVFLPQQLTVQLS